MRAAPLSKSFGSILRKRRIQRGLSQETLAERARLHPTYVSMVERGIRNPTLDVAARLANALNVHLSVLIDEAQANRRGGAE